MAIWSDFCFATLPTLAEGKVAQCFRDLHLSGESLLMGLKSQCVLHPLLIIILVVKVCGNSKLVCIVSLTMAVGGFS